MQNNFSTNPKLEIKKLLKSFLVQSFLKDKSEIKSPYFFIIHIMILDDTVNQINMHTKSKHAAVQFSRNQRAQIASQDAVLVILEGPRNDLTQTF
jgi:hypothetical protein